VTAPSSIDPARFLHDQLASASPDLLRSMLTTFVNALMSAEADAICCAPYGMPSPDRVNVRNGYRHRDFDTRAGTLDVAIPKLRSGSYFPDWLLERRRRAEAALTSVVATCYLLGVSTRRMEKLVDSLGITRLSRSQVSEMARDLDAQVEAFRTRPLDAGPYTFVAADALVLKVREGGRGERRRAPGDPGPAGHLRRGRRRVAGLLPGPDRPRPDRRRPGHLRRPPRPGRGDRRDPARRVVAKVPHALKP
jgi:putative transposase